MIEELNDLQSSHVRAASYNTVSKEMHVDFHNGDRYRYADVTPMDWQNLHDAKSPGRFLHKQIISHKQGTKVVRP